MCLCLLSALYTNVYPVCFPDQETQEESSWITSDQQQTVPLSDEELRQRRMLHLESRFSQGFPICCKKGQEGKKSDDFFLTLNHCACITGIMSNFPLKLGYWQSHDQILHSDWTALPSLIPRL